MLYVYYRLSLYAVCTYICMYVRTYRDCRQILCIMHHVCMCVVVHCTLYM